MYFIIPSIICLLAGLTSATDESIYISEANSQLNTDKICSSYTDCFNCTISNCQWAGFANACSINPADDFTSAVKIENFLLKSGACGDPLNVCGYI